MSNLNRRDIEEMMRDYAHEHQERTTAPLDREHVERLLKEMMRPIHDKAGFGVTLTEDHNGAWGGQLGQRFLTLRFSDSKGDHITVGMVIKEISSYAADERQHELKTENK